MPVWIVVEDIDEERQWIHWYARLQRIGALASRQTLRLGQLTQRVRQIGGADPPLAPSALLLIPRGEDPDAGEHRHAGRHPTHRHADA
jgi:hypothetical protein